MSHFVVLVVTDDPSKETLAAALAPYQDAKWDWWVVGGRWGGWLQAKPGAERHVGDPSTFGYSAGLKEKRGTDKAQRKDLDFEAMMDIAEPGARAKHRIYYEAAEGVPELMTWDEATEGLPPDMKQGAFWGQGVIKRLQDHPESKEVFGFMYGVEGLEELAAYPDVEEYVRLQREMSILPLAILDEDGWHEGGRMLMFGILDDEDEGWARKASARLLSIDDDKWITAVDCHI